MSRPLLLAFSLGAFIYLVYFSVVKTLPYVAQDLQERSLAVLQFRGLHNITVSAQGQTITATGIARNLQEKQHALSSIASVWGVQKVLDNLELFIPKPYELYIDFDGNDVLLSGYIESNEIRDELISALINSYGDAHVTDTLEVAHGAPNKLLAAATQAAIPGLNQLEYGSVIFRDEKLEFNGVVRKSDSQKKLTQLLQQQLPGNFGYEIIVDSPTENELSRATGEATPTASPKVSIATCQAALNRLLAQQNIEFNSGKSTLTVSSKSVLKSIATTLDGCNAKKVRIEGYTDSRGAKADNIKLSKSRATAVMQQLESLGIAPDLMKTKGLGEASPIASNKTAKGRAQNRRIEIHLQ